MAGERKLTVVLAGDSRGLERAMNNADRATSNLGGKLAAFGKTAAIGIGALGAGAVVLGKTFVDAAVESQKVTAQTEAVIKSMGGVANVTSQQVADLSTALSLKTGIDDELIQSGQNVLLTFGKVQNAVGKGPKIFDRATQAALDMSVALGQDMNSAAMMVGKALNDPVRGLTALRRSGIQFTKQQEDQIKKMVEAGNVAGAQAVMLKELEAQFGGSAEAQATAGDKLKVVWGNLQEQLGEKLLPMFEKAATWLADVLPRALEKLGQFIGPIAREIGMFWGALTSGKTEDEGTRIERFALMVRNAGIDVAEFVRDKLSQLRNWWDEHGPAITEAFKGFGEDVQTYVLDPLGELARFIGEEVLPKLGDVVTWIAEHKAALEAFGILIGVTLVAHFGALAAAAVTSAMASLAAWAAAVAPIVLMIATVGALTAITTMAMNTDGFAKLLQWAADLAGWVKKIAAALGVIEPKIRALMGLAGTAGGLIPDLPGGPREATVNPLTGEPIRTNTVRYQSTKEPPRFHDGGVFNSGRGEGLALLRDGEGVFTPGQMAALGSSNVTNNYTITVPAGTPEQMAWNVVRELRRDALIAAAP